MGSLHPSKTVKASGGCHTQATTGSGHHGVLGTAMGLARAEGRAPVDQNGRQQGEPPTAGIRGYPGLTGSPLPTAVR